MNHQYYQWQQHPLQSQYADRLRLCNAKMLLCLLSVGWGSLSVGYNLYPTIPDFINGEALFETAIFDLVLYMPDLGGIFGALSAGVLCDRYGRRPAILIGATITLIASGIRTASINLAMFLAFEFFVGLGCTILLVSIPVWIAEVAPPKGRAILISVHPIAIILGSCLPAWIGLAASNAMNDHSAWKFTTGIGCAWPFLCLLSCFEYLLPESPRWLLRHGQADRAWKIIADLHTSSGDVDHHGPRREFEQMARSIESERALRSGYGALLTQRPYRRRTFIACALSFFVLSSGVYVIRAFESEFWVILGYPSTNSIFLHEYIWSTAIVGMSIFTLFIIEKMPRGAMIFVGFFGTHACLIASTYIVASYEFLATGSARGFAIGAIALIYMWGLFYVVFLVGSKFIYTAEIFPNHLRAKGMALAMVSLSVTDAMWTIASSYALPVIGWKFFIIFIVLGVVAMIVLLRKYPDTRNVPLEDIGKLFGEYGQSNNGWNVAEHGNPNDYAWSPAQPADWFLHPGQNVAQGPHGVRGSYRSHELYGIQDSAEVYGNPQYEMNGQSQPAQVGGRGVYEFPGANSRQGSHRQRV